MPAKKTASCDTSRNAPRLKLRLAMPQLIEVENEQGKSVQVGAWLQRDDGSWVLRLPISGELVATPAE